MTNSGDPLHVRMTFNGSDLEVVVPTMKSLFIEMCRGDMVLATGTAFLAARRKDSHCALITNRHNVTGRHQETGQCLHRHGAVPDRMVIHFHKNEADGVVGWNPISLPLYRPDETPFWIEHPRLGAGADLVALNLRWGDDVSRYPYFVDGELDKAGLAVGPAEPVSVIGFPFGLTSSGKFPVWATGFLAQELELVTHENPVFLIDCRTRQGQSGSPVIAYRPGTHRRREGSQIKSVMGGETVWEFLGIYSGRVNPESDLGRVWHADAVVEVLDAAEAAMRNPT